MNYIKHIFLITLANTLFILMLLGPAEATVHFIYDAENGTPGSNLPWSSETGLNNENFQPTAYLSGNGVVRGTIANTVKTPDGSKYANFRIPLTENTATHQAKKANFSMPEDSVLYLAFYHNAKSLDGSDIWNESGQSISKSLGLDLSGTRWALSFGQWGECNDTSTFVNNQDHHYTIVIGNPSYHINPSLEAYGPNVNGYSCKNTPQFAYGEWHVFVFAVKLSANGANGYIKLWVDGVLTHDYLNINTVAAGQAAPYDFKYIEMVGTTSQNLNDHPVHDRMFDKIMLADNWQDIVSGGYLSAAPVPAPGFVAPTITGITITPQK